MVSWSVDLHFCIFLQDMEEGLLTRSWVTGNSDDLTHPTCKYMFKDCATFVGKRKRGRYMARERGGESLFSGELRSRRPLRRLSAADHSREVPTYCLCTITGLASVSSVKMAARKASKSQWNRCRDIRGKCERTVCRARWWTSSLRAWTKQPTWLSVLSAIRYLVKDLSHVYKLAKVHTYLLTLRDIENLFFAAYPKRAGSLWRRLLLLLSSLFQVRQKFFFSNKKMLEKSLRSANCNNHE